MGAGTHPVVYPYLAMPPWVHPPAHVMAGTVEHGYALVVKCAMGSKRTSNQSQMALEVNLRATIWPLALF